MPIRIAVTGDLGSGKSTVCGNLHSKYGLTVFSTGAIQRKIATDMGMTTFELNKYMETHPEIDRRIDSELADLSNTEIDIAIDSRMAWHFVRDTFKVFLVTDETVAAQRIIGDTRGPAERYSDIRDAKELLKARKISENFRFKEKYGVDCYDLRNYDLIIDATIDASVVSPAYTAELIMSQYNLWAKGAGQASFWISKYCLYPTKDIRNMSAETVGKYCGAISQNVTLPPVDILLSDGLFYMYDGHHRAAAFYKSQCPLVPCALLAENGGLLAGGLSAAQYVDSGYSLSKAYNWEEYNGFHYFSYPRE